MADNFDPKIGKTVLETLTEGMYDDGRFIFREYVQNAADQIDRAVELGLLADKSEGKINISIDKSLRKIVVYDNATGISQKDVLQFLGDVANSQKDGVKQRGFRGIGRLGGLGYCNKLIFETSFKGEAVCSKMSLDARLLKKIIEDRKDTRDAAGALSVITSIERLQEDPDQHYFRVILQDVTVEKVLDITGVRDYLSMVAPVPFNNSFSFSEEIKSYLKSRNLILDEYNVAINEETLFKRYKNTFQEDDETTSSLIGVDFFDIYNEEQELLALCWYGYRDKSNYQISEINLERGLRIRTKNITIGDEFTCNRFFSQARTNHRFIGEIHTLSESFIPNARRDYFNENHTCQQFETSARTIITEQNLENRLAQTASKLYSRLKEIETYQKSYSDFATKKGNYDSAAGETYHLNRLRVLEEKAVRAKADIEKIAAKSTNSPKMQTLYTSIIGAKDLDLVRLTSDDLRVSKYTPPEFSKLNDEQKDVVLDIFDILEDELDFDTSELIKKRIVEKFN